MSEVQAPIIKDVTGQSMLTQLTAMVTKLQGIIDGLTPVASQIGVTTTGMHVITEDEVQGALTEVDTALNNINASLTNLETTHTASGTTTSGGLLAPDILATEYMIDSCFCSGSNIAIPFVALSDSKWRFLILSTTLQIQANTSVTVTYTKKPIAT